MQNTISKRLDISIISYNSGIWEICSFIWNYMEFIMEIAPNINISLFFWWLLWLMIQIHTKLSKYKMKKSFNIIFTKQSFMSEISSKIISNCVPYSRNKITQFWSYFLSLLCNNKGQHKIRIYIYKHTTALSGPRIWEECTITVIAELQPFHRLYHSACIISHSECHGRRPQIH